MEREMDTPALCIDESIMRSNISRMADAARNAGVKLRPHVKTHKIPGVAKLQLAAGAAGITAAKLSEAEVFADEGIKDIFIAYPIIGGMKAERAVRLAQRITLSVGVDSLEGAHCLSEAAVRAGCLMRVRLEIETGLRRTGVSQEAAIETAIAIHKLEGLELEGIFTYRGSMIGGSPSLDIERAGKEEGELMVSTANMLRSAGVNIREVSVGSTPTAMYAAAVPGVTEIRPGTYVFQDRMQAAYGVCSSEDWAASVLVTVISRPEADRIVVDGGSKTFATDVQPGSGVIQLQGFGEVLGYPHAIIERMNEEHGVIRVDERDPFQIGDRIRIVPNHICSTVNLHNQAFIIGREGTRRVEVAARGRLA